MITPYILKEFLFYVLVSDHYSALAAVQVWVFELVSGKKKWYLNISKFYEEEKRSSIIRHMTTPLRTRGPDQLGALLPAWACNRCQPCHGRHRHTASCAIHRAEGSGQSSSALLTDSSLIPLWLSPPTEFKREWVPESEWLVPPFSEC